MNPQEALWASELKKNKRQASALDRTSTVVQESKLREEMNQCKMVLSRALKHNQHQEIDRVANDLLNLRAKQAALHLQRYKESGILLTQDIILTESNRYYEDCYRLIESVTLLSAESHA